MAHRAQAHQLIIRLTLIMFVGSTSILLFRFRNVPKKLSLCSRGNFQRTVSFYPYLKHSKYNPSRSTALRQDSEGQQLGCSLINSSIVRSSFIPKQNFKYPKFDRRSSSKLNRTAQRPVYASRSPLSSLPDEYYQVFNYYGAEVSFFQRHNDEEVDPKKWKATGVRAILTKDFLLHGTKIAGRKAYSSPHYPPGWSSLQFPTRGHLLAKQLGGDGAYLLNIVSLNRKINCEDMNRVEQTVRSVYSQPTCLSENCSVLYIVRAVYMPDVDYPIVLYISASIVNKKDLTFRRPWFLYHMTQHESKFIFRNTLPESMDCRFPTGPPNIY